LKRRKIRVDQGDDEPGQQEAGHGEAGSGCQGVKEIAG